jgi:hypothetical protein
MEETKVDFLVMYLLLYSQLNIDHHRMFEQKKNVHQVHLYNERDKHLMNEVYQDDENKLLEYQYD